MNDQERLIAQMDGVVNLACQRVGSLEVEKALARDPNVSEVVVVPIVFHLDGQVVSAFVTLKEGVTESEELKIELTNRVLEEIGPIGIPDKIYFVPSLPKTRSGKIMRDILEEMVENQL